LPSAEIFLNLIFLTYPFAFLCVLRNVLPIIPFARSELSH
jgi:hypothetical protein